ncbi:uncharacterized protein LOC128732470 [Sabethes cyaneus]|uniref:uncharacterized protein LOC128732470 n=1 Tax=Sabethes cyaneus TaxID=53552 RepID=UPI00237DB5D6|nr:uncharacterized protein LOC128732470 [Sabethes cyaneus]
MPTSSQDLPEEMLVHIFSYLELDDRKTVATVCRRWSELAFRWNEVQLEIDLRQSGVEATYHRVLKASERPYRHLMIIFGYDQAKCVLLLHILARFYDSLESLTILPDNFVPVELHLLAQVFALCPNLKRLHVEYCTFQHRRGAEIYFTPLTNLFDLYVDNNLLDMREIDIREAMPNITGLNLQISYYSKRPQVVLQHFSPRLIKLGVCFLTEDHFPRICEISFPLLKKLNFYCVDCNFDDFRLIERFAHFIQRCPDLTEVILRCNINALVMKNIAQICTNLQYLCLSTKEHTTECFHYLSELHNLKLLRIEDAIISVPEVEQFVVFKTLHTLTLYSVQITHVNKFNSFVRNCFPKLATLELLNVCRRMNQADMFKLYSTVCHDFVTLECLVLSESGKLLDLDLFFYFASLPRLRELRLRFRNLTDCICPYATNIMYIETLTLDVPQIHDECLHKLTELLPRVRLIVLSENNGCSVEGIRTARDRLTQCDIRVKRKVHIEVQWS